MLNMIWFGYMVFNSLVYIMVLFYIMVLYGSVHVVVLVVLVLCCRGTDLVWHEWFAGTLVRMVWFGKNGLVW